MNLDMSLSRHFLGGLIAACLNPAKAPKAVTVTIMGKAFHTTLGRPPWSQADVFSGKCSQDAKDLDVEVWNRALAKAFEADYTLENLR